MTAILDFYNGKQAEGCNHRLPDAWEYPYARYEREHDLIQWLFPLNEPSNYNPMPPSSLMFNTGIGFSFAWLTKPLKPR